MSTLTAEPVAAGRALEIEAAVALRKYIDRSFDMSLAIEALLDAGVPFHITGGAVRSSILSPGSYSDLDLVVAGGQETAARFFRGLGLEETTTRYGDVRFFWNRLAIDLLATPESVDPAIGLERLLRTFDLTVNAIAFDPREDAVLDPLNALGDAKGGLIRVHRPAWEGARVSALANQCLRLLRLFHEVPHLRLVQEDLDLLADIVRPELEDADWADLGIRFPPGRGRFLSLFEAFLSSRQQRVGSPVERHRE